MGGSNRHVLQMTEGFLRQEMQRYNLFEHAKSTGKVALPTPRRLDDSMKLSFGAGFDTFNFNDSMAEMMSQMAGTTSDGNVADMQWASTGDATMPSSSSSSSSSAALQSSLEKLALGGNGNGNAA